MQWIKIVDEWIKFNGDLESLRKRWIGTIKEDRPWRMIPKGRSENKGKYDHGGKAKFNPYKVESKFRTNFLR